MEKSDLTSSSKRKTRNSSLVFLDEYSQQKYALEFWEQVKNKKEMKFKPQQQETQTSNNVGISSIDQSTETREKETTSLKRTKSLSPSPQKKQKTVKETSNNSISTTNKKKLEKQITVSNKERKQRKIPKEEFQLFSEDQLCRHDTLTLFNRRHFREQLRKHAVNQSSKILRQGFQFAPVKEIPEKNKTTTKKQVALDFVFKDLIESYESSVSSSDFDSVLHIHQQSPSLPQQTLATELSLTQQPNTKVRRKAPPKRSTSASKDENQNNDNHQNNECGDLENEKNDFQNESLSDTRENQNEMDDTKTPN